jgi:hypothetical protein
MSSKPVLNILYTNIGRGHPFYLDGVVQKLKSNYDDDLELNIYDVFELSRGVPRKLWEMARFLYKAGSQGGVTGRLYGALRARREPGKKSFAEKIMARDLRNFLKKNRHPTLVAHPILVPMISDIVPTYYQHGEIAVPDEAAVSGASRIFLPLPICKDRFACRGIPDDLLTISGLCIENGLRADARDYFEKRFQRLAGNTILTGGFFSSGAEPHQHVKKIILAVLSLSKSKQKGIIFCRHGERLAAALERCTKVPIYSSAEAVKILGESESGKDIIAVSYRNRHEENKAADLLFGHLDYFVAPSHERTNWAVGLGIPIFILHPIIGTFSPLNQNFLTEEGVGFDLKGDKEAGKFATLLLEFHREKILISMAEKGFGKYDINGFQNIAEYLRNNLMRCRS